MVALSRAMRKPDLSRVCDGIVVPPGVSTRLLFGVEQGCARPRSARGLLPHVMLECELESPERFLSCEPLRRVTRVMGV